MCNRIREEDLVTGGGYLQAPCPCQIIIPVSLRNFLKGSCKALGGGLVESMQSDQKKGLKRRGKLSDLMVAMSYQNRRTFR